MYNSQVSPAAGLLTTVRDGRWGFHEVQRWLDKKPVKDRYDSPRGERFFARPDGVYTIAEAAEYFAQEPNWKEGEDNSSMRTTRRPWPISSLRTPQTSICTSG